MTRVATRRVNMLQHAAGLFGALIVGAALAMSGGAWAQERVPITAPTEQAGNVPGAPQIQAPPVESPGLPGWNNPPKAWEPLSETRQYASLPGIETNRLIQGAGREWRALRNGPVTQLGGWFLVLVLAAILLFYFIKGTIRLKEPRTGRLIERFNAVERVSHWTMAISFIFLALTGIVIFWGKHIVLPWLGYSGFSWLTIVSKNIHNFVGPLFIFSLLVSFLIFVKDNLLRSYDWTWIKHFGGMFGSKEIPSGRFNGMEKMWFWGGLTLLGTVLAATGLILDFPNWQQTREVMQVSNIIHLIAAIGFIAGAMGHIYIGTIGMEGAYTAMRRGYVDEAWARQHHLLWYEEVRAGKRAEKIVVPAGAQPIAGDD
jgi:formate dehydrogenase subunit gamma